MTISDIYSERQKELRGEAPDVFIYDDFPNPLRVQIVQIYSKIIGEDKYRRHYPEPYKFIVDILCEDYGVSNLSSGNRTSSRDYKNELREFVLQEQDQKKVVRSLEVICFTIENLTKKFGYRQFLIVPKMIDSAIEELNSRFKEHGVGYQYVEGKIIRVDSQFVHTEVVKPALILLHADEYDGAQQEYLSAYEHYRQGKPKEALNDCLKAFESTMKIICDKRGWTYDSKSTSHALIETCMNKGLIPEFWQGHYSSLRSSLGNGIPTGRNRLSGHGQGTDPRSVPNHLVAYMLHMTASAIVFLVEAEASLDKQASDSK